MNIDISSNHEECEGRSSQFKLTKGFSTKESVKGYMVNVVKGLKLYEDIFTDSKLSKLSYFVKEIHTTGQNGELSGETFILLNKQMKGNKRELIQRGVPKLQTNRVYFQYRNISILKSRLEAEAAATSECERSISKVGIYNGFSITCSYCWVYGRSSNNNLPTTAKIDFRP